MPVAKKSKARRPPAPRTYPNRITELKKLFGWSNQDVADRLNAMLPGEKFHEQTIGALARGDAELTFTWMQRFARLFGVKPIEIVERQVADGLRTVEIDGSVAAGAWADHHTFDPQDRRSVTVPNDKEFAGLQLYARVIEGLSMNRLYAPGSIVILSRLLQRPNEIIAGKRYHVRRTRGDLSEETIKTLVRDARGEYWLKPESDSPEFSAFPLEGADNEIVELLGRVRYALTVE